MNKIRISFALLTFISFAGVANATPLVSKLILKPDEKSYYSKFTVTGKVLDSEGLVLVGANVIIKDSYLGTVSNNNGEFSFKKLTAGDYRLIVSYLGYETEEKPIHLEGDSEVSFQLKHSSN
jgi:hypothetical protein